jgi:hypothetical protein
MALPENIGLGWKSLLTLANTLKFVKFGQKSFITLAGGDLRSHRVCGEGVSREEHGGGDHGGVL